MHHFHPGYGAARPVCSLCLHPYDEADPAAPRCECGRLTASDWTRVAVAFAIVAVVWIAAGFLVWRAFQGGGDA